MFDDRLQSVVHQKARKGKAFPWDLFCSSMVSRFLPFSLVENGSISDFGPRGEG